MRRVLLWSVMVFSLVGAAFAQDSDWAAWVYTQRTGVVRQIDSGGTVVQELTLPLPTGSAADLYPDQIAVSHDGTLFAYVVTRSVDEGTQLVVFSADADDILTSYDFPTGATVSLQLAASPAVFSELDGQIAFGYGTPDGSWQVVVLDFVTNMNFTLDAGGTLAAGAGIDAATAGMAVIPVIQAYRGGSIDFTLVDESQAFAGPSYQWDTVANTLARTDIYPTVFGDSLLMTGEAVVPVLDDAFAMRADAFYPVNTVRVYDPALGAYFPFVATQNGIINFARFVQNGELVAVSLVEPNAEPVIRLFRRDGGVWGEYTFAPTSLYGTFNGFVFTGASPVNPTMTDLYYEDTRSTADSGGVVTVWSSPLDEEARLVWTSDNFMIGPVEPTPWAMLAAPMIVDTVGVAIAPGPTPTLAAVALPTLAPSFAPATVVASPAGLAVGADAIVNTTEGDVLRMRSGAGLTFAIVRELQDQTRVTLIEGPRGADGLVWWRIRLPDGTSGWAVEAVDGIATLVPVFAG